MIVDVCKCVFTQPDTPSIFQLPVSGGWWPINLVDRILVAELSVTQWLKLSYDVLSSTLALTGPERVVGEVRSDHSADYLKLSYRSANIKRTHQIAHLANKYSSQFYV